MIGEDVKNITVQLDPYLLELVDKRAEQLDLNRSQYFRRLARQDLGDEVPELKTPPPAPQPDLPGMKEKVAA